MTDFKKVEWEGLRSITVHYQVKGTGKTLCGLKDTSSPYYPVHDITHLSCEVECKTCLRIAGSNN